jgi:hypothetical protein
VHDEKDMQNQEVEAPIDRIRQPASDEKRRLAKSFARSANPQAAMTKVRPTAILRMPMAGQSEIDDGA